MKLFDANVGLGHWPFRKIAIETPDALQAELSRAGISQALVYSLNAVFYKDVQSGNMELAPLRDASWPEVCAVINPTRPGALEDLAESVEKLDVCAVRLFPGYHCYGLDDPKVAAFIEKSGEIRPRVPVLITVRLEDERVHHPMALVPPPDLRHVTPLARRFPDTPIILMGANSADARQVFGGVPKEAAVYYEIARMTDQEFLPSILKAIPSDRLIFGTNLPLFTPESSVLKVSEAEVSQDIKEQVFHRNLASALRLNE